MHALDRQIALAELTCFQEEHAAKYHKAVECLTKDKETLSTFMDYPAARWILLRTPNAIESTFATVRARTRSTTSFCLSSNSQFGLFAANTAD
jgi:putative transposase